MTEKHDVALADPVIYWFRQDLRLQDLPALAAASATGKPVLACYILDDNSAGDWRIGSASRWWLHHSLAALADAIAAAGGQLLYARGDSADVLAQLAADTGAEQVFCSRQYEPWARQLEDSTHTSLAEQNIELRRYGGGLLWEPETVANQAGLPFKVFTPFWRKCRTMPIAAPVTGKPGFSAWPQGATAALSLGELDLQPSQPDWAKGWECLWHPGEKGAARRLKKFLTGAVDEYDAARNFPARQATSGLSPHLHYGEISPAQVFRQARAQGAANAVLESETEKFLSELGWREFSHHLLFHFPELPEQAFKDKFAHFPWLGGVTALRAWQQGNTGYPIVDAGMRELWHTGYMHNRVRMVAASFLCKHLLIDWRAGQRWFWDTLVDADLANNACGWQWVAGSGADAAPYFRIFNPVLQGQKFDREGVYVRRWVPELAKLPDRFLHAPWTAPADVLESAGVTLGGSYPLPVVDHKDARNAALAAYADIKSG